jgi:hypothetical protein
MADAEEDGEVEQIDPRVLKPDLYEAAKRNDTAGVARLLLDQVPPTFVDTTNGWTVRSLPPSTLLVSLMDCLTCSSSLSSSFLSSHCIGPPSMATSRC